MLGLRLATLEDAQQLFRWRNDPQTCANSVNHNPIEWDGHCLWLKRCLADPTRHLFVAELDGVPIGTARIDDHGDVQELSWTIDPEHRRKGLGTTMVSLVLAQTTKPVMALVFPHNTASLKIAARLGIRVCLVTERVA